ncbi:arylsulfatase [Haloactinopolyspora alba]|uniref:Arylsulfatase n=1 Tax=Haloactinopolyspora alba TaxID=648780 RepID=A0A2P8DRD9_9ACTN|nr:arylsulfatase [Haloactinopolyspora alba]PSK99783.1 arylsulfatase [Haloactinopolyspora alba]
MSTDGNHSPDGFQGTIGTTYQDSTPWWPPETGPAPGTPNVVLVLFDDVGFSSLGCYGSEIATPTLDALAARGLRYNNFHTTALCSPTRASLLTGRNHHSVGMSIISNADSGYPSKRGAVCHEAGTLAEMLRAQGHHTMAVGKWHLAPADQTSAAGPYDQWPLGRGFDRFYGFMDALTDQFHPELVHDNHRVDPPKSPEEGYTFNEDMIDHAISFTTDQVSVAPEQPFFLYLAPGAAHSPHQAPQEYLDRYRGAYDRGWDEVRAERFERQKAMGLIPADTDLPPRNPGVQAWDELSEDQRRVYARLQEAFAAFVEHTDHELGRLVEHLERLGQLDDTVFVLLSDNGASQEGQINGSVNTGFYENSQVDPLEYNLSHLDDIGTERAQNNYPLGWAQVGNTPLKRYKQNTHAGGVRDPLIVSWPRGISEQGGIRTQFHHVVDIAPTLLEILGAEAPETIRGVPQMPLHGTSMAYTFDADGPTRKESQYFEMFGSRAIWQNGWKAVAFHEPGSDYADDVWELYDLTADFSECHDLAEQEPELLRMLVEAWWEEARRYGVLPLDDRRFAERRAEAQARRHSPRSRSTFTYYPGMTRVPSGVAPFVLDRSYTVTARVSLSAPDEGVLVSCGSVSGGYVLYVQNGLLVHDYNYYGRIFRVTAEITGTDGQQPTEHELTYRFDKSGELKGTGSLAIDGVASGHVDIPETYRHFMDWAGLEVGRDALSPVSDGYRAPFPFTGTIHHVTFELGDDTDGVDDYEPQD